MPSRSAKGDVQDPTKRRRGYAALLAAAAGAGPMAPAVTTGNASGKLGA